MFSAMTFIHQAIQADLKPIIGLETVLEMDQSKISVILYAKNNQGLSGLFELSSLLGLREQKILTKSEVQKYMEDLIVLTSGVDETIEQMIVQGDNEQLILLFEEMQEMNPDFLLRLR